MLSDVLDEISRPVDMVSEGALKRLVARANSLWKAWSPDYRWWDGLSLAGMYLFLLYFLQPSLLLAPTTTAGGDTGSHHYLATFMRENLLPRLTLSGWSPDWYAGLPMTTFYFPLPYILIALGSLVVPYLISFKLVTVLGIFLLPAAIYICLRLLRLPFPLPALGALVAIPFLFLEQITAQQIYSIYGGNIPSTLAGEFPYSLGLALAILFVGVSWRGMEEQRYLLPAALLLAATSWAHLLPTGLAVVSAIFGVFGPNLRKRALYLLGVFALAFGLSAVWTLPFLAHLPWMVRMEWAQVNGFEFLAPEAFRVYAVFGILGAIYGLRRLFSERDARVLIFLVPVALVIALFFLLPEGGPIWNARFLPFLYIYTGILAAYGLWALQRPVVLALNILAGITRQTGRIVFPLVALGAVLAGTYASTSYIPGWIDWNYSGFERKAGWSTVQEVTRYLDKLPPGRVMVEYTAKYDRFGTPRVFELIPYFTRQPTMEGLLVESSISAPYHFYMQAEVSEESSKAVQGIVYPSFDFETGLLHMDLFNIRYFMATSLKAKQAADAHPEIVRLKDIAEFTVYELPNPGYVSALPEKPQLLTFADWRKKSFDWYKRPGDLYLPVVFAEGLSSQRKAAFRRGPARPQSVPIIYDSGIKSERISAERIEFVTEQVGKPHLVRVSYFPNWRAQGADGPYLASPSLMVVVPRQERVVLQYGRGPAEWAGLGLTIVSLLIVLLMVARGVLRRSDARAQRGGGQPPT